MIFISKGGNDPYINDIARSQGIAPISDADFEYSKQGPIFLRGLLKYKIMRNCEKDNIDYYFIDTGYFGNQPSAKNPNGWKLWHRIVKNNLVHTEITNIDPQRLKQHNIKRKKFNKNGNKIIIAAPDEKPCKVYGVDYESWAKDTKQKIEEYTDRPVVIRQRVKNRQERIVHKPLVEELKDAFALVTFNSNSSVEAILNGVPVFTLAPNAADPVASKDIQKIESPFYPDDDLVYNWMCNLANGQFNVSELRNGYAIRKLLNENS